MHYSQIKTYEDACAVLGIDPNNLPDVSMLPTEDQAHLLAAYKLPKIIKAANAGWQPDWTNEDEYKYQPYFWLNDDSAADGFSLAYVIDYCSASGVGSRLCFRDRETAETIVAQFIDLYRDYYLITKPAKN